MAAVAAPIFIDRSKHLYEIRDHLSALYDTLEGAPPELHAEIEAQIAAYEEAEIRKVDGVASYIAFCESQQLLAAAEVKRLHERKAMWERRQAHLEQSIVRVLHAAGKTELHGNTATLKLKKCPPSVNILDESLVPKEYIRTKTETSVDKVEAARALKAGVEIDGLALVTNKQTVVVK